MKNADVCGLSNFEVESKLSAGLTNKPIDSVSPTYLRIVLRNTFNLINIFLGPLLILLGYFGKYKEVFVILSFAVVNSLISMLDEIRIKRRLDKIQLDFIKTVRVIREGHELSLPADQIVIGDVVKINEGEGVPTDGVILKAESLLIDESVLTGESDYISKKSDEKILGGSFLVTGECIYKVSEVGSNSYVNKLAGESRNYKKEKSNLQKIGDKLTVFFVISSLIFGFASYFSARLLGNSIEVSILPLVSVVSLIIPQTLIFLFTFTFSISVLKLSKMGVLVQRGSSIESLANLDILCFDKTGTITTNQMRVIDTNYWNLNKELVASIFTSIKDLVYGRNKTFESIIEHFRDSQSVVVSEFEQIPFTSKSKFAVNQFRMEGKSGYFFIRYGAMSQIAKYIDRRQQSNVEKYVEEQELIGRRVVVGVIYQNGNRVNIEEFEKSSNKVFSISLREDYNIGISDAINKFKDLGTELKIISGDSYISVKKILDSVDIQYQKIADLSEEGVDIALAAGKYDVFVRAKPDDKLSIIRALKSKNKKVGMVGDGVNDVLALKSSNLSIAMESGSKMARDVSDIVLTNNNFSLVPEILYEAENIVANLKYMNKLFLSKTFHAMFFVFIAILLGRIFPLLPASILIYSFLASSLPSYITVFWRRNISDNEDFVRTVMPVSIISAIFSAISSGIIYVLHFDFDLVYINTAVVYGALLFSSMFAVEQLWVSNYLRRWYEPIISIFGLVLVGIIPLFIPLLEIYYDITFININTWILIIIVSSISFLFYLLCRKVYERYISI